MIIDKQAAVREFMVKHAFKTDIGMNGTKVEWLEAGFWRSRLIEEELGELSEAWLKRDVVGIADAIADLLYVVYGTAAKVGIDIEPIFDAVHYSNMTKETRGGDFGKPKGPAFVPAGPAIRECLRRQGFFKTEEVAVEANEAVPDAP